MRTIFFLGAVAALGALSACSSDSSGDVGGGAAASGGQAGSSGEGGAGQSQGGDGNGQSGAGSAGQGGAGMAGAGQGGAGMAGAGMAGFTTVGSNKPRNDGSKVSMGDRTAVADGNNAFALDLYGQLQNTPGVSGKNLFFSPISITLALGMTVAGAQGATRSELAHVMHFKLPETSLQPALGALSLTMSKYPEKAKQFAKQQQTSSEPEVRLNLINSMWGEQSYSWQAPFLDVLAEDYGAGVNQVDFKGNPDGERVVINDWVAGQTEQRIKDLLPQDAITDETRFVLVNAIDLTFPWADPFDPDHTAKASFSIEGGTTASIPMMENSLTTPFAEDDLAQLIELDLYDRTLTLDFYVPKAGKFADFEAALGTELASLRGAAQQENLALTLPKFTYQTTDPLDLAMLFETLGAPTAFDPSAADFSAMTTDDKLHLTHIFHKATLGIDEGGVQAAAASAALGAAGGAGAPKYTKVDINRSFFLTLRDKSTGAILFFGRVLDPSQG